MIDDWFDVIELSIPFDQFLALPRNPAYKYEYWDGRAVLSPRPKSYWAVLELTPRPGPGPIDVGGPVVVRPLRDGDWESFPSLFAYAFHQVPPFVGIAEDLRPEAARECLEKTRAGGDGPLIPSACFVAVGQDDSRPIGAALITLPTNYDEDELRDFGPDGAVPHLTWIFVAPRIARHGVGSALLDSSAIALIELGHRRLASTFLLGNESSTLWHWSNGFRLLSYVCSPRALKAWARRNNADPKGDPAA